MNIVTTCIGELSEGLREAAIKAQRERRKRGNIYSPYLRALKNYRYFHFIGVVRRHYRAFTRRSGYDVW